MLTGHASKCSSPSQLRLAGELRAACGWRVRWAGRSVRRLLRRAEPHDSATTTTELDRWRHTCPVCLLCTLPAWPAWRRRAALRAASAGSTAMLLAHNSLHDYDKHNNQVQMQCAGCCKNAGATWGLRKVRPEQTRVGSSFRPIGQSDAVFRPAYAAQERQQQQQQ